MNPVLDVGDKICIEWPSETNEMIWYDCECIEVERQKKSKNGSFFKYKLCTIDHREVISTRLLHMSWRRISGTTLPVELVPSKKRRLSLPAHRFICAPMVGASELAFRLLCRKYGVQLAYTPMINSELFATDAAYREQEFQTTPEDRPLVAHFSGNNPSALVAAARYIENKCDAIDLNLGCPQRVAYAGHFGSFLLDEQDRDLVLSIVRALSENINLPIFVKIRLLDSVPDTIRLCRQLVEAGAALIAIHARYRVNLVARTGPGARDGPAHLDQVATIKKAVPGIPIIANGNVVTWNDIVRNLEFTGADGIMSAEGLLDNPAIFAPSLSQEDHRYHELDEVPARSKLQLAMEYLSFADKYPVKMK
jgi:tRNA-dihydrouridine synthase 1